MNWLEQGQMTLFGAEESTTDTQFTKTSPVRSRRTTDTIGKPYLQSLSASSSRLLPQCLCLNRGDGLTAEASMAWEWTDNPLPWLGACTTHNGLVSHNDGKDFAFWLTTPELQRRGYCLTLNMSERPRTVRRTLLSETLEDSVDEKYLLSQKACVGILRRAEKRGKELPKALKDALTEQAGNLLTVASVFKNEPDAPGGGKGILIQHEHVGTLSTLNNQSVFPIEGNGARESHKGCGYGEENAPMFTLNSTEHHAVGTIETGCGGGRSAIGLDHVLMSGGTTFQGRGYYNEKSGCLKTMPHGVLDEKQ